MSTEKSKRDSKVKTLKKELGLIGGISLGRFKNLTACSDQSKEGKQQQRESVHYQERGPTIRP